MPESVVGRVTLLYKHMTVISEGPLMMVRCPAVERKGDYYAAPKWKAVISAMTLNMKSHGLKKKDLYALDPAGWPGSDTYQSYEAVYASGQGDERLPSFWLYDWDDALQEFKLVREALVR